MSNADKENPEYSSIRGTGRPENKPGTISLKKWWFLDDRPIIQANEDAIWRQGNGEIWRQLEDIVEQITSPLESSNPMPGMTFGVFGDWGAGKSSFMRMLQGKISESLGDSEKSRSMIFCTYTASAYAYSDVSIRKTLALQLMHGLEKAGHRICNHLLSRHPSGQVSELLESLSKLKETQEAMEELMNSKDLPTFLSEVFSGNTEINNGKPFVAVYLIDDLDRCPLDIVERVLQTTHEWADVRNLFFVLAINREWLLRAIKQLVHVADEPDYALEKYLQHSITLGNLEGDALVLYVKNLLGQYGGIYRKTSRKMLCICRKV